MGQLEVIKLNFIFRFFEKTDLIGPVYRWCELEQRRWLSTPLQLDVEEDSVVVLPPLPVSWQQEEVDSVVQKRVVGRR